MRWHIIALLALAVAVSGCFGDGPTQLSEPEAKEHTQDAVQAFAADFSDPEGGDIRKITGEFEAAAGDGEFGFGDFDILMEWGKGGATHVRFEVAASGMPIAVEVYCTPDRVVIVWDGDAFESRPSEEGTCMDSLGGDTQVSDPFELEQLDEDLEGIDVTPHADGSVTATYTDENGTFILHIDAKGRLVRIEIDSEEATGVMDIEYGARGTIDVPAASQKVPAGVSGFGFFDSQAGQYEWKASGSDEESFPLDEFEVRVLDEGDVVASFRLDGADQEQGGFSFTFSDDGDDRFGGGDSFTVSHADWTEADQYDVVVWDLWADRDIEDNPMPGWGAGLGILALAGIAARRRFT